jgi:hypothetical protein
VENSLDLVSAVAKRRDQFIPSSPVLLPDEQIQINCLPGVTVSDHCVPSDHEEL